MQLERERPPERIYVARRIEKGSIAFENVIFKYPNGADEAALDKVSFKIAGGERVGIIGRVGSGKTTVGRLLAGFYEPHDGKVSIDGVDARQYDPADLRTGVGFVLQDTDLFFGKLRDNIALGKPTATDEEIIAAARLAGVESFIAGHPLGYDMPIAEGGRSLSGGQKQAIGLARALIRKPKVLFLDEPTAHFDVRSEADFLERLKEIAADNMTIVISTHRLSLLSFVDRMLLFERGKLVADGPRDKVIAMLRGGPTKVRGHRDGGGKRSEDRCVQSDFAFANDVRAAAELRTPRTSRMLLVAIIRSARLRDDLGAFRHSRRGQARPGQSDPLAADAGPAVARRRPGRGDRRPGRRHRAEGPGAHAHRRHEILRRPRRGPAPSARRPPTA